MTAFINLRSAVLLVSLGTGSTLTLLAPVSAAEVVIQMRGTGAWPDTYRYEPATVEVKSGDTITWRNNSNMTHTATPDPGFEALLQDTGDVARGRESTPQTITAGPISYYCEFLYGHMRGTIIVAK
jgi:plastocyanin